MKNRIFILSAILLLASSLFAKDIPVKSSIKQVTVFLSGAEITRKASLNLTPGTHTIKFTDLSQFINNNSVQAAGSGNYTILSVTPKRNYFIAQKQSPKYKQLNDSLTLLRDQLNLQREYKSVYQQEKNMILANQKILALKPNTSAKTEIEQMANFYRSRLMELAKLMHKSTNTEQKLQTEINRISNQMSQIGQGNKTTAEVWVEIAVKKAGRASMEISYTNNRARWTPTYDVRVNGKNETVNIAYNAQVFQTTGVDWKGVKLSLSTSNPNQSTRVPVLSPWSLNFIAPRAAGYDYGGNPNSNMYTPRKKYENKTRAISMDDAEVENISEEPLTFANTSAQFTQLKESQLNQTFNIKILSDIPSDGAAHKVNVNNIKAEAEFAYTAIPKKQQKAFLLCKLKDWEKFNFISGSSNLYFNNAYVGKGYIDANNTSETLNLSMGADPQINVKRSRIETFCETKLIGANKRETIGIEVALKNTKSSTIKLKISEQIPISANSAIEVELLEQSGAKFNEQTGELTWNLELAPGQEQKLVFKYQVKYPKDKKINL